MHHNLKTTLVIVFLLSMTTYVGLVLTQTNLGDLIGGKATLTGGTVAQNCQGEECIAPVIGCGDERSGYACRVACYSDEDCDDNIPQTDDICRNPGTVNSLCVNKIVKE